MCLFPECPAAWTAAVGAPGDGFAASRKKISTDPLLVEITWHTHAKPYELSSEKKSMWMRGPGNEVSREVK